MNKSIFMVVLPIFIVLLSTSIYLHGLVKLDNYKIQQYIQQDQWKYIRDAIYTQYEENFIKSKYHANNLQNKILLTYGDDTDRLLEDFKNLGKKPSILSSLIINEVNETHVVPNKSGKSYIGLVNYGIIEVYGDNLKYIPWEEYISEHANPILGKKAVDIFIVSDPFNVNNIVFWETKESSNTNHAIIESMDDHSLRDIFIQEGLTGLSTYEFLPYSYIKDKSDIFDTPDTDADGRKISNYKIIYIESFNIADEITNEIEKYEKVTDKYNIRIGKLEGYKRVADVLSIISCIFGGYVIYYMVTLSFSKISRKNEEDE